MDELRHSQLEIFYCTIFAKGNAQVLAKSARLHARIILSITAIRDFAAIRDETNVYLEGSCYRHCK